MTGTVLFTAAALLTVFDWGPVLWAALGPKMDIEPGTQHLAILQWFVLSLVAAADAFNFSRRGRI